MAFFKSRAPSPSQAESAKDDAQSMDSLRKQARHRLIGATVLVVIAVLGFPLVFDTKPRDLASDIRIDMPDRDAVRPSQPPTVAIPDKLDNAKVSLSEAVSANEQVVVDDNKKAVAPAVNPPSESSSSDTKSTETKPKAEAAKTAPAPADATASAKPAAKEAVAERFIVQFGAFSDEAKVKEVRSKLEKSGVKTYVHVAQTPEGKRTRVRAGPFASREEAQKIITKTKSLSLNAVVLTL
jgi:DedD protein